MEPARFDTRRTAPRVAAVRLARAEGDRGHGHASRNGAAHQSRTPESALFGTPLVLRRLWSAFGRARRSPRSPRRRLTVVLSTQCLDQLALLLRDSLERGHEGIVYFVGLTTGTTTLALSAMRPQAAATPESVDVAALELGKIIREAALAGLQVVGQLHTHPCDCLSQCWRSCRDAYPAPRLRLDRGSRVRCWTAIAGPCPHVDVDHRRIQRA